MTTPASTEYAFPRNDQGQMDCLQIFLDPITQRQLRALKITPGMRCWELGAGGGSIAAHLADLVGPTGLVVATDRNTTQLGHLTSRVNVHVHTQDARELNIPTPRRFDLFTSRLTLLHIPQRRDILAAAVDTLNPDGRVLLGEFDCTQAMRVLTSPSEQATALFYRVTGAIIDILTSRGMDPAWAQHTHAALVEAGLTDVVTTSHQESWVGGSSGCLLHDINSRQLEPQLLDQGIEEKDLAGFRQLMHNHEFSAMSYTFVSTRGRKPQ